MIGWGGRPNFTEFDSRGEEVYDAQFPVGDNSYRVYREQWSGQPLEPPSVVAVTSAGATTAYVSWNGATDVAQWQLLAGDSPSDLRVVSNTPVGGFETTIATAQTPHLEVRALNSAGEPLGAAALIKPAVG